MNKIHTIVGTETGTAQSLAFDIATLLQSPPYKALQFQMEIVVEPDLEQILQYPKDDVLLICTATCGKGEIPVNIKPFYQQLTAQANTLEGLRFGMICLGDSSFKHFANAGETMNIALSQAGFILTGEMLKIDGFIDKSPLDQVKPWMLQWVSLL